MHESIHLGRVRGIPIGMHWSVLVIAGLLAWGLADGILRDAAPGYPAATYWIVAVVTAVCFFSALLAHELSHSLVANRHGVVVDGITLWLFGGVSRLRTEAHEPAVELRIAVAGPLVSLAIAAIAGVIALGLDAAGGPALGVAAFGWLAFINAVLAVFNLAPAAPLDGGRILHAVVWRHSGDHDHATQVATDAGVTFGYLLVALGVLMLAAAGNIGGVWFAVLGWFLVNAAKAESTHVMLEAALAKVRVRDVMTADPIVVPDDTTVGELIDDWFLRHHCSAFPVVDRAGDVSGLVTLRRLRSLRAYERGQLAIDVARPIAEVPKAAPDESLLAVLERLAPHEDGRVLVFEAGRLVGIISPTDVNRSLDLAGLRRSPLQPSIRPPTRPPSQLAGRAS